MKISELPWEYRELAKKNAETAALYSEPKENPNPDSLVFSFMWGKSPEKTSFWARCANAKDISELPPLPASEEV